MNREIRRELSNQAADSDVLNDRSVYPRGDNGAEVVFRVGQFIGKNERIERDVSAHSAPMEKLHQSWEVSLGEILRAHARIEPFQTKVDGIRPILHGCPRAFP